MMSTNKKKKIGNKEVKSKKKTGTNGISGDRSLSNNTIWEEECSSVDTLCIAGFSMFVGSVYIYTMYPTISGGDSGELIAAAHELGVAHPPGYPLFTMLAWICIKTIPFASVAWRVNLLNAVFAGLAAFFFTVTIYRYTKNVGCAMLGTSVWAFCKLTWIWSSNAEVFGLNNFFVASVLYLMVVFQDSNEERKEKVAYFGSFYCGLALCNQHTIVVYVIVVGAWVLAELRAIRKLTLLLLLKIGLSFLMGLVPYVYLPLSASLRSGRWTWGDQTTLAGFIKHFLRQEYGTFDLARNQGDSGHGLIAGLNRYFIHASTEFTVFGIILFMIGVFDAIQRLRYDRQKSLFVSFSMALLYLMFFSWRANLDLTNELFLGVVERFWLQCDAILVLLAAVGLSRILKLLQDRISALNITICSVSLALCVLALQLGKNFPYCNQRHNRIIEEFGHRLMYNMPKNTLLLQVGDLSSNLLRYQYLCENTRPDISILDVELMTYPWAVPIWRKSYPEIIFPGDTFYKTDMRKPDGEIIFSFRTFLNANYHRPIISCIGMKTHDYIQKQGFELLPFGPCSLVLKSPVDLEKNYYPLVDLAVNVTEGWSHKFESQDPTSWERVAAGEMWNARVNIPLFLYYRSQSEKNEFEKVKLMTKSYQLYKAAISKLKVEDIPDYYHKNFALSCDKMLSFQHNLPKSVILNEVIEHFSLFIKKNPNDKDSPAIRNAIETYKKALGKF